MSLYQFWYLFHICQVLIFVSFSQAGGFLIQEIPIFVFSSSLLSPGHCDYKVTLFCDCILCKKYPFYCAGNKIFTGWLIYNATISGIYINQ